MGKGKQMILGAAITAMICTGILLNGAIPCRAAGETYATALEASYADTFRDLCVNRPAGSPLEAEAADGVDTSTGHLVLSRTDLSLEGTGGMDLELTRYYDSSAADLGYAQVEHVQSVKRDTINVYYTAEDNTERIIVINTALLSNHKDAVKNLIGASYERGEGDDETDIDVVGGKEGTQRTRTAAGEGRDVYGVACGWRYDLPYIGTVALAGDEGWGKIPVYLHLGSAGVLDIRYEADAGTKTYRITGLEDYGYQDIRLEDFQGTVDGIRCRYLLRDKTGMRTYFNQDGVIVLQKDVHDNRIAYNYTGDGIHFSKITDSAGREILFHYSGDGDEQVLESVTVQGTAVEGGVPSKTVTYETEEKAYTPLNGDRLRGSVLTGATVDGSRETYAYKTVERLVNACGNGVGTHRGSTNQSFLLTKVKADGSETRYEYRACAMQGKRDAEAGEERDVAVERFYVTREYQRDTATGKRSDGVKYDYFQKQDGTLYSYADFQKGTNMWQYGRNGLETLAVVSTFNPNKYKTNNKYYDTGYKKSKIRESTLKLKTDTKKNVSLYLYNKNRMLVQQTEYGEEKQETLYTYDNGGEGSLVVLETGKSYGKKGNGAVTTKRGYTYDAYCNLLTSRNPKAYRKKNKGKEHLYTTTYTYHATNKGYPAGDAAAALSILVTQESYTSADTKVRMSATVAANGADYASIAEQRSVNGGAYKTISRTDFQYDKQGNETQGKVYPSYSTDGENEVIQNDYTYNSLGQQTKNTVTITSAKRPADNRTYTEEEVTYDSFGNELSYTDENGLVSKTSYDPETGEETETINAVGTEYETKGKEYQSADGLKTMTVDNYGRVAIEIRDAFGNTILSKDEAAGTWTESIYDYGSGGADTGDGSDGTGEDTEEDGVEKEETTRLIEERTYAFAPDEKRFIINEDGETVPNYYITGRGKEILSGSKHFYDNLGNKTGSAGFSNGELDAAHCSAWSFTKNETEVTGEEDEAQTIATSYQKKLDPSAYQPEADPENYYDQFNDAVLSETITETVTDAEGNTLSGTSITIRGKNRLETVTTYETNDFGRTTKETTVTRKQQDGKWLPAYETQAVYTYDDNGNVSQTETKSRKEGETEWQTRTVKTDYDDQGQVTKEYTPRGTKENAATKYEYDILGRMVRSEIPQEKKDGSIEYQKTTTEYDNTGNMTEKSEQIDGDRTAKTEYTYDRRGSLVMVRSCLEGDKEPDGSSIKNEDHSSYVQYVYDTEGNKVRQFTGMTEPLEITVAEIKQEEAEEEGMDTFSYAGKMYAVTISGQKKTDDIHETKYEYDGKNQLVSYTDPEGRRETYTYDVNSNLTKTVDKNGNMLKNTYDHRNRLTEMVAKEKKTGKETKHTYTYNAYGDVATQDGTAFAYDDASGQVTKETTKLTKHKDVVKTYTYDSAGNKSAFAVKVGGETELSLQYAYDGESRLTAVTDEKGNEAARYSYDMDGNLAERTVPGNSMTSSYTYDYQNRLTAVKNQTGSAGVISEYSSEYLANGQKSKENSDIVDKEGKKIKKTATYTYDLLGRITKETKTGSEDISYTYDSNNNRKEMTVGNKVTAYKYNKNDELLRTDTLNTDTEEDSVVIYKYDKNGNQLATVNRYEIPAEKKDKPYIDIDVTLGDNRLNENVVNHYNAENQLTRTLTKNYKVSFTYDAEGLRTSKTVNGEKTVFVWDGDQLMMELSDSGKVQKRYVRGNDRGYGSNLVYADKGENTEKKYYVTDPHGNVVQLTDENGKVTKTYEYDSFGNEVKPEKKDENPFRYCGEYYDKETEKIYLRARYYQPAVGRFLTRDNYTGEEDEPESLHLYTYCENDGVNSVDPSGHWKKNVHERITKDAIKKVGTKFKSYVRRYKLKYKKAYSYVKFGSVLPDILRSDRKKKKSNEYFTILSIDFMGKGTENNKYWNGSDRDLLNNVQQQVIDCVRGEGHYMSRAGINKENVKLMFILIGAALHTTQDYYAHSYVMTARYFKCNYENYGIGSEVAVYHKDRWKKVNGKMVLLSKYDRIEHKKHKDNEKSDFRDGKWKGCTYKSNNRIKASISESVSFLKYITKSYF